MPCSNSTATLRLCAACMLLQLLLTTAQAAVRNVPANPLNARNVTCDFPVRLTRDCSIWQGATRPIAFDRYRMTLAADRNGRTILLSKLRPEPSHNGPEFGSALASPAPRYSSADAIRRLEAALEDRGIRLERLRPLRRGQRVDGYFLEFSANAYDYLAQFTVLESEYWLPKQHSLR